MRPEKWSNPANRLFPYQVGSTAPPHDFDAEPSDFLRMSPASMSVHGWMPKYAHKLQQRAKYFHLLEEFVACISNNGADVCGQWEPSAFRLWANTVDSYQSWFNWIKASPPAAGSAGESVPL